jgi:hypothetical protein
MRTIFENENMDNGYTSLYHLFLLEMHVLNSLGKITPGVGPVNFW